MLHSIHRRTTFCISENYSSKYSKFMQIFPYGSQILLKLDTFLVSVFTGKYVVLRPRDPICCVNLETSELSRDNIQYTLSRAEA